MPCGGIGLIGRDPVLGNAFKRVPIAVRFKGRCEQEFRQGLVGSLPEGRVLGGSGKPGYRLPGNLVAGPGKRKHEMEITAGDDLESDDADKASGGVEKRSATLAVVERRRNLQDPCAIVFVQPFYLPLADAELCASRVPGGNYRIAELQIFCRADGGRFRSRQRRNGKDAQVVLGICIGRVGGPLQNLPPHPDRLCTTGDVTGSQESSRSNQYCRSIGYKPAAEALDPVHRSRGIGLRTNVCRVRTKRGEREQQQKQERQAKHS